MLLDAIKLGTPLPTVYNNTYDGSVTLSISKAVPRGYRLSPGIEEQEELVEDLMRQHHHSASPYESQVGFSRAIRHGDRIAVAGTAPIGTDGETVTGDAYVQARRCFTIIVEAVEALGGRAEDIVRTRIYLTETDDWQAVGRAHGEFFAGIDPAATMVTVKELLDPHWRVEIEAEAIVSPSSSTLEEAG